MTHRSELPCSSSCCCSTSSLLGTSRIARSSSAVALQGVLLGPAAAAGPRALGLPCRMVLLVAAIVAQGRAHPASCCCTPCATRRSSARSSRCIGFLPSLLLGAARHGFALLFADTLPLAGRARRHPAGARLARHGADRLPAAHHPAQGDHPGGRLPGAGERHLHLRPAAARGDAVPGRDRRAARPVRRHLRDGHHHPPHQPRVLLAWTRGGWPR